MMLLGSWQAAPLIKIDSFTKYWGIPVKAFTKKSDILLYVALMFSSIWWLISVVIRPEKTRLWSPGSAEAPPNLMLMPEICMTWPISSSNIQKSWARMSVFHILFGLSGPGIRPGLGIESGMTAIVSMTWGRAHELWHESPTYSISHIYHFCLPTRLKWLSCRKVQLIWGIFNGNDLKLIFCVRSKMPDWSGPLWGRSWPGHRCGINRTGPVQQSAAGTEVFTPRRACKQNLNKKNPNVWLIFSVPCVWTGPSRGESCYHIRLTAWRCPLQRKQTSTITSVVLWHLFTLFSLKLGRNFVISIFQISRHLCTPGPLYLQRCLVVSFYFSVQNKKIRLMQTFYTVCVGRCVFPACQAAEETW